MGLLVTGLYLVWSGVYSIYFGIRFDWEGWITADYLDMIFAMIAGLFVISAGLVSFIKR